LRAPPEIGRRNRFQATASVYVMFTFGSAEEFLGSPQLNDTSCVISDVQMSPMNGRELLANMRIRGYAAPFIFVTAFPMKASAPVRWRPTRPASLPSRLQRRT